MMRVKPMPNQYLDIRVQPDPETNAPQLLGALYGRLHLALVDQQRSDIGVSFPQYSRNPRALGNVLRLHGELQALQSLMQQDWLKGMRDHVRMTEISPVPEDVQHCCFTRKQFKTNAERLRRRRMQRKGETAEQAAAAIPASIERKPDLPYVHLRSHSNAQAFCLFIAKGRAQPQAEKGSFNSYGLSNTATVPCF